MYSDSLSRTLKLCSYTRWCVRKDTTKNKAATLLASSEQRDTDSRQQSRRKEPNQQIAVQCCLYSRSPHACPAACSKNGQRHHDEWHRQRSLGQNPIAGSRPHQCQANRGKGKGRGSVGSSTGVPGCGLSAGEAAEARMPTFWAQRTRAASFGRGDRPAVLPVVAHAQRARELSAGVRQERHHCQQN